MHGLKQRERRKEKVGRQVRFAFILLFLNTLTVIKVTEIYLTEVKGLEVISKSPLITVEYYNQVIIIVLSNN